RLRRIAHPGRLFPAAAGCAAAFSVRRPDGQFGHGATARHRRQQPHGISARAQYGRFRGAGPAPNIVSAIYFDGILQPASDYGIDRATGFAPSPAPPPAGQSVTAAFTYYFRVRFADDTAEFENFMIQLWQARQIKLQSVFL